MSLFRKVIKRVIEDYRGRISFVKVARNSRELERKLEHDRRVLDAAIRDLKLRKEALEDAAWRLKYEADILDAIHYGRLDGCIIENKPSEECFYAREKGNRNILRITYEMLDSLSEGEIHEGNESLYKGEE